MHLLSSQINFTQAISPCEIIEIIEAPRWAPYPYIHSFIPECIFKGNGDSCVYFSVAPLFGELCGHFLQLKALHILQSIYMK